MVCSLYMHFQYKIGNSIQFLIEQSGQVRFNSLIPQSPGTWLLCRAECSHFSDIFLIHSCASWEHFCIIGRNFLLYKKVSACRHSPAGGFYVIGRNFLLHKKKQTFSYAKAMFVLFLSLAFCCSCRDSFYKVLLKYTKNG
jgi:hypothetical protein